jgi:DNA-binding beta-propeller fold protein YncE
VRNMIRFFALSAACLGPVALGGCSATMRSGGGGIPATSAASGSERALSAGVATLLDPVRGLGRTNSPSPGAATRHASWMAPGVDAKAAPLLYVANWYGNGVEVYSAKTRAHVGHIDTSPYQPNSVHVAGGEIWVALNNAGSDPSIYVYKPGATSPFRTLTGVSNVPVSIALARNGTVYVTDENFSSGEVIVFGPGSNTPTATLTDPGATCCGWVAVDRGGNVFFTYQSASGHTGTVDEFVRGSKTPKSLGITLGTFPGGIEVLKNGSLLIVEQGIPSFNLAAKIDTFPKGASQPSSIIAGDPTCDNWVGPALSKDEHTVYVGSTLEANNICNVNGAFGTLEEYSYPSGTLLDKFNGGLTNQPGWTLLVPATAPAPAGQ